MKRRRDIMKLIQFYLLSFSFLALLTTTGCTTMTTILKAPKQLKQLPSAIVCKENNRLIIHVQQVKKPFAVAMKETHLSSKSSSTPIPYPPTRAGGLAASATGLLDAINIETNNYRSDFEYNLATVLNEKDCQELLISSIKKSLTSKSSCPTIYVSSDDLKQFTFLPSDRLIILAFVWYYHGNKPTMKTALRWKYISNIDNIPIVETKEEELDKLYDIFIDTLTTEEIRKEAGLLSLMNKIERKKKDVLVYCDAYGSIIYDSQAYKRNIWYKDDGHLFKQEIETAIDELTGKLAIALFPGERGKEDESTRQGSASPPTTTPQPSTTLQPSLSPPPQPQEPTEEGLDDRGIISITTDPSAAKVFIDGEYKGQTPAEISLTIGTHQIFLQRQLCAPYKDSVMIEKGQTKTLNIKLSPEEKEQ